MFSEDFEDGFAGWSVPAPVTGGRHRLPVGGDARRPVDGHAGTVARGPDPDIHCADEDPTSANFLTSPSFVVPANVSAPRMSFDNYVATEEGFDGGNVQLSVNGGAFVPIPAAAYTFNGPANLLTAAEGNDNPLAGQPAFSGADFGSVFGTWAVSQVDLTAAGVAPGDTVAHPPRGGPRLLHRQRRVVRRRHRDPGVRPARRRGHERDADGHADHRHAFADAHQRRLRRSRWRRR